MSVAAELDLKSAESLPKASVSPSSPPPPPPHHHSPTPRHTTVQLHVCTGSSKHMISPRTVQQVPEPWHVP